MTFRISAVHGNRALSVLPGIEQERVQLRATAERLGEIDLDSRGFPEGLVVLRFDQQRLSELFERGRRVALGVLFIRARNVRLCGESLCKNHRWRNA